MRGKEYVNVLEQVEKRNNGEKEFRCCKRSINSIAPVFDKHPEYIEEGLLERISRTRKTNVL